MESRSGVAVGPGAAPDVVGGSGAVADAGAGVDGVGAGVGATTGCAESAWIASVWRRFAAARSSMLR